MLRRLDSLVRDHGARVVLIRDPYYQGLVGLYLRWAHGIPLVVRVGGNDDANHAVTGQRAYPRLFPSRRAEKLVERRVLSRADLIAGANEDNREAAIRSGAPRERTTLFRYGNLLDPAHFAPLETRPGMQEARREVGLPGRRLLVFVGRLERVKRAMDLVEAMPDVLAAHPDAGLVIVGEGSLRSPMEMRARELHVDHAIAFVGNRPQRWIAALLPQAAVAMSPHMGRALAECSLAGLPAVAYALDWQAELVQEGETGFLVPPGDVGGLAKGIVRVLADPAEAARMGRAARERALDMMDQGRLSDHERACYMRLLGRVA
jgi:glycosyltransferase involved in cell wall biosynthesis